MNTCNSQISQGRNTHTTPLESLQENGKASRAHWLVPPLWDGDCLCKSTHWCDAEKNIFFGESGCACHQCPCLHKSLDSTHCGIGWPRIGRNQAVQHVTLKNWAHLQTRIVRAMVQSWSFQHRPGWLLANEWADICEYLLGTCQCSTVQASSRTDPAQGKEDHGSTPGVSGSPWFRYVAYVASHHAKREIQRIQHSSPQQWPRRTGIQVTSAWPSKDKLNQRAGVTWDKISRDEAGN